MRCTTCDSPLHFAIEVATTLCYDCQAASRSHPELLLLPLPRYHLRVDILLGAVVVFGIVFGMVVSVVGVLA